jgi:hypothetical protein
MDISPTQWRGCGFQFKPTPSLGCDLEDAYLGPFHSVSGDGRGLAEPSSKGPFDQTPS